MLIQHLSDQCFLYLPTVFPSMALSEWQVSKFSLHKLQAELQSIPSKINCETERSRNTLTTAYELLSNTLCCQENSQPPEALHLIQGRNICPAPRLISRIWPQVLLGFVASHVVLKIWRGYDLRESLIELIIGLFETSRKYLKNRVWLVSWTITNPLRCVTSLFIMYFNRACVFFFCSYSLPFSIANYSLLSKYTTQYVTIDMSLPYKVMARLKPIWHHSNVWWKRSPRKHSTIQKVRLLKLLNRCVNGGLLLLITFF